MSESTYSCKKHDTNTEWDGQQFVCPECAVEGGLITRQSVKIRLDKLWAKHPAPLFADILHEVDQAIMDEIHKERSGVALALYTYFDDFEKPLNPREFLEFWLHLPTADKLELALRPEMYFKE